MISVTEAGTIIRKHTVRLQAQSVNLAEAAAKLLAEDVYAQVDIPPFPQSSMDGYAFFYDDWKEQHPLLIEGVIEAGHRQQAVLKPGTVTRIFTGAPVPEGADTVIMQERVRVDGDHLIIEDDKILKGTNVRPQGSEIKSGAVALEKGSLLNPAAIAFLAGLGITEVPVVPNPRISIIVTGNELQKPGNPLEYGQVYESSSYSLMAALKERGMDNTRVLFCNDDLERLTGILKEALDSSDMVLLTGGISAGDYDFVFRAAEQNGVKKLFHKIRQRPGKPLYFGKKENRLVFGLPGNPSSVLTCFYEYVLPALESLTGQRLSLQAIQVPLAAGYVKKAALTHFLKGFYDGKEVHILDAQESYRLSSFARANCLVVLPEESMEFPGGSLLEIHLLP